MIREEDINKLSTEEKYHLFKEALNKEDYIEANKFRECDDSRLQNMITSKEKDKVHEGIRKGFLEGRYGYR